MSSIMRWRNGLMGLSVMAITPVSHEVSEPHDLETGRAILLIPTSNPPRARSRWGVYRESGLVHGGRAVTHRVGGATRKLGPSLRRFLGAPGVTDREMLEPGKIAEFVARNADRRAGLLQRSEKLIGLLLSI